MVRRLVLHIVQPIIPLPRRPRPTAIEQHVVIGHVEMRYNRSSSFSMSMGSDEGAGMGIETSLFWSGKQSLAAECLSF